jgi:hypothetical protein
LFCWILMTFFYSDENFGFNWNHFTTSILRAQKTFSSRTLRSCPNSKQKPFIRPKPKEKFGLWTQYFSRGREISSEITF